MTSDDTPKDPYALPQRHTDSSGAVIRVLVLAGLLGLAGAGYVIYAQQAPAGAADSAMAQRQFADANEAPAQPIRVSLRNG